MKRRRCIISLVAFIACALRIVPASMAQETLHPYLQNPSPTSITINWLSHANEPTSLVRFGTSPQDLTQTAEGTLQRMGSFNFHTVHLHELTPNTKYYYRISARDREGTLHQGEGTKSFHTLPLPGQAATTDGHLRFLILGDNQLQGNDRYNRLVKAAHDKIMQKYGYKGSTPDDHITMTVMVGDQVDLGMYAHYENVHFAKNRLLSAYLPIQTLIGNHETYSIPGLKLYSDIFEMDGWEYQGTASGTEDFFAHQVGNTLFIGFCSEKTNEATPELQLAWLERIMQKVDKDPTVEWIISLSHRPYQTEQYIGDICTWVREQAVPIMKRSAKYILHIGAHHHNYARGQLKENPVYHIISGGTSWDQYWGMGKEQDFDDVQKTLAQWCYQIVDIDVKNQRFTCEAYSIGSILEEKESELVDLFYHDRKTPPPAKPSITTAFHRENTLPLTIESSLFQSPAGEPINSTQFLFSRDPDFQKIALEMYRDYENLFGMKNNRKDQTMDLNLGINLHSITLPPKALHNGKNYVKVRHRDRNMQWSPWSEVKEFTITGSTNPPVALWTDRNAYSLTEALTVHFSDASEKPAARVEVKKNDTKELHAKENISQRKHGSVTFSSLGSRQNNVIKAFTPGLYHAEIYNTLTEKATETPTFYVGTIPKLRIDRERYQTHEPVVLHLSQAPHLTTDAVHIFRVGDSLHTMQQPACTLPITRAEDEITLSSLSKGYYYAQYYLEGNSMVIGNTLHFQVGDQVTQVSTDKKQYHLHEPITVTWSDAPGIPKDWIGIYPREHNPEEDSSDESGYSYTYFEGKPAGSITIAPKELPQKAGDYFLAIFTNDSYTEISNRAYFSVSDPSAPDSPSTPPNPTHEPPMANSADPTPNEYHACRNHLLRCSPNPVTGVLSILCEIPTRATLHSLSGTQIMRFPLHEGHNPVSMGHLPQGVYLLRAEHGATVRIVKL